MQLYEFDCIIKRKHVRETKNKKEIKKKDTQIL